MAEYVIAAYKTSSGKTGRRKIHVRQTALETIRLGAYADEVRLHVKSPGRHELNGEWVREEGMWRKEGANG